MKAAKVRWGAHAHTSAGWHTHARTHAHRRRWPMDAPEPAFLLWQAPLVMAKLSVSSPAAAAPTTLVTDSTWQCRASSVSHIGGAWGSGGFGGDAVDDRMALPGWDEPGLAATGWHNATVYEHDATISADVMEPTVR